MPINQGHILQKIRQYLTDENRSASFIESFLNKQGKPKGFCQGFTNIWEIDPLWCSSMLEKLSNYGEKPLSATEKNEIDTFISYLKFYQSPYSYIAAGQGQLDKIDAVFLGEQGSIRVVAGKAALVTEDPVIIHKNLQELFAKGKIVSMTLEAKITNPKNGQEEFQSHQVSARMNDDGSYTYYDPNSKTGEKTFSGKMSLLKLAEEIAGWNRQSGRKEFSIGLIAFNKIPSSQKELKDSKTEVIHNVFYQSKDINLALATAVRIDDTPMIKELLKDGADPNYKIGGKETALFLSIRSGHIESAKLLLEKSNAKNIARSLIGAAEFGQLETSQLLLSKLEEFKDEKLKLEGAGLALIAAVKSDHPHIVKELLTYKIPDKFLTSALHTAFSTDSPIIQRILIDKGVSLDKINNSGMTLLEEACLELNVAKIKKLLDLGASPNAHGQAERLFEYIQSLEDPNDHAEIRKLLILAGAKIPTDMQPVAIQVALMAGRHDALKSILEDGANPNLAQVKTMTPLIIAIGKLDLTAVDLLLAAGADPRKTAPAGQANALATVERMLIAAKSASDVTKVEKLTAIQIKLNEHLSQMIKSPQQEVTAAPKDSKDSRASANQYALLGSCKPKDIPKTPAAEISVSASLA